MKSSTSFLGLIILYVLKATLVWSIWLTVISAMALIGAARMVGVWRNRSPG